MSSLKPFFTYYGGKYRIAPKYPLPRKVTIVEPFAGSAGYSLRYPNRQVVLYDLNPKVFGTWDYLIKTSSLEILRLPLEVEDVRDLHIPQEAKWLIGWWLNKGNFQPCNIPSLWMRQKIRPNSYWGRAIRTRIACQVHKIRHWKIFNVGYEQAEEQEATWFIDPPYQRSGKVYPFNEIDYAHLRNWSMSRREQVIACGQQGDDWLPFVPFLDAKVMGGCKGRIKPQTSKEVIWTNNLA